MAKPVVVKRKIEIIMDEDGITFKFLEEARNRTRRENIKDVIRDGIDFYDLILSKIYLGKHVYIGESRETSGEVILEHLEVARGVCKLRLV